MRYVYISHSALAHHGIKKMKWGVRNGPPYPLSPSAHSAAEKKANNGKYSQGVKQDRGKKKREPMSEEKKRKIKKAIAIGAGVAGAAALTAGGIYLARNPNVTKAALSGIKDLAIGAGKSIKSSKAIKSGIKNKEIANQALKNLKSSNKQRRSDVFNSIKKASTVDKENHLLAKWDRQAKRQERKGILTGDIIKNKDRLKESILARPERLTKNRAAIVKEHGEEAWDNLASAVARRQSSERVASKAFNEYKSNKGIKGVAKKVWAPVAGAAGVAGTVTGTLGRFNSAVNTVGNTVNNPYLKKAYNAYMADPYEDEYQETQNNQQKKKKR